MIPKEKQTRTAKNIGKIIKKETQRLVGCGLRTVFCSQAFLPSRMTRRRAAGGAKNKNYQSRARKTTAVKRQTLPRGCSSKHAWINIQVENGKKTSPCATLKQNQKERTHGKRQNINRFLIVVIIFFSKNERFFTILIKI